MRRLPLVAFVAAIALPGLVSSCSHDGDSVVYVDVLAGDTFPAAYQLRATLSNEGNHDMTSVPTTPRANKIDFPTAFTLTLPRDRAGNLDIALDALGSTGSVVANGTGSVVLQPGAQVSLSITLHAGVSACGNGVIDAGEDCDDGDRFTNGTCDFQCRRRVATGTGGATGSGGTGLDGGHGSGGAPGTGGVAFGSGGLALGTGGVAIGTGGVALGTGGVAPGTGGVTPGTGGRGTGGSPGTGGVAPGTGGRGTGGSPGTGGAPGTGGRGTGGSPFGTGGFICTGEYLKDGNFESGDHSVWTTKSPAGSPLIYTTDDPRLKPMGLTAPSPPTLAWLGEGNSALNGGGDEFLQQAMTIPGPILRLTIMGLVYIAPTPDNGCSPDCAPPLFVEVLDGSGKPVVIKTWTAADVKAGFLAFNAQVDFANLISRDIILRFRLTNSAVDKSYFNVFLDQLSLTPMACDPGF